MATFADLQTKVSSRLLDPNGQAVSSADVAAAINDSISYWKYRAFWFNTVYDSGTMTLQDGTIPLPSDFLCPATDDGAFQIEYSEQRFILCKLNSEQYNAKYRGNGYGRPQFYARIGQSYEVYPLPDRAYTIKRSYLKDYAALSNGTDTNDFTTNAGRLIVLWSVANLIAELRQDEKMESYFRNAAEDQYRQLTVMTDKSDGTGSLEVY